MSFVIDEPDPQTNIFDAMQVVWVALNRDMVLRSPRLNERAAEVAVRALRKRGYLR